MADTKRVMVTNIHTGIPRRNRFRRTASFLLLLAWLIPACTPGPAPEPATQAPLAIPSATSAPATAEPAAMDTALPVPITSSTEEPTQTPPPPTETNPAPTETEAPPAVPSPTNTSAPSATPTAVEVAFDFQELIRFGEGGGGGGCQPFGRTLPMVTRDSERGYPERQSFSACLLGMPPGADVGLTIIDPKGNEKKWANVRIPTDPFPGGQENYTFLELPGFVSLALVSPDWKLRVSVNGETYESGLYKSDFDYWWDPGEKVVTYSRFPTGQQVNPLDPSLRRPFKTGDTVYIQGINFAPNAALPLGIYHGNTELKFIRAFTAQTDGQGSFEVALTIGPEFAEGYNAVVPADFFSTESDFLTSGAFANFSVRNKFPYQVCENAPKSNLTVGMRVIMADQKANNLRYGPGTYDFYPVIGRIDTGQHMRILGGPECSDGYVWWLVRNDKTHMVGWTAEGDANKAWLKPSD